MTKEAIKNTQICIENGEEFYEKWFKTTRANFIQHVDTLYFMVTPKMDEKDEDGNTVTWNKSRKKGNYIEYLKIIKENASVMRMPAPIFEDITDGLEVNPNMRAIMYNLHFGKEDNFDIFTCENVINNDTPPIMVQIRSNSLWLNGLKKSFDEAYDTVEKVLKKFGIEIESTQENRIDFAFHTNYINNAMQFFPENDLKRMQISNFGRGCKEFDLQTLDTEEVESDYFTLGRRKSNNVFFRAYNKTKEVIEMGYKQFFIKIWQKYGLISEFDKYVLERAHKKGSYESKDRARCEFYYDYGKDEEQRKLIYDKLDNSDTPIKWFTKKAKELVPDITIITNIEIETKRKFYDRIKPEMITKDETPKRNVYNLFEQMKGLTEHITHDTIRFVKYKGEYANVEREKRPNADWWDRLRSAKVVEIEGTREVKYIRAYQHKLDIIRQITLSKRKMASMGAYFNVTDKLIQEKELIAQTSPQEDFTRFLSFLNDNDIQDYYRIKARKIKELERWADEPKKV